jgi:hypothetical protein
VEETVLDLAQLAWTFDDACGWLTQACGRRLTTAPGPDPAEARLDWQAPAVLASLPRAAGVTAAIDLRSLRPSRQPPREVPRLT